MALRSALASLPRCRGGPRDVVEGPTAAVRAGKHELGGNTRGMDTRRHAPIGRRRVHGRQQRAPRRPCLAIAGAARRLHDLYTSDHADARQARPFPLAVQHLPGGGGRHARHPGRDRRLNGSAGSRGRHLVGARAPGRCPPGLLAPAVGARRWTALGDPQDRPPADRQRRLGDQVRHSRSHSPAPRQPRLHDEQALCAAGRPAGAALPRPRHKGSRPSIPSSSMPIPTRSMPPTAARTACRMPAPSSWSCWAASCRPRMARNSPARM